MHISDVPAAVKAAGVRSALDSAGWTLQFSEAGIAWANHSVVAEPRWPERFTAGGRLAHSTWEQLTATTIRVAARRITIPATPAVHAQLTLAARAAGVPLVTWALNTLTAAANATGAATVANPSPAIANTPHGPRPNTRAPTPRAAAKTTKATTRPRAQPDPNQPKVTAPPRP